MFRFPLLVVLLISQALTAAERPKVPAPGQDKELFGGKTAREFFKARAADTACRKDLEEARKQFIEQRDELVKLLPGKDAGRIDAQERRMISTRKSYLGSLAKCGHCATRKVEKRVVETPARTEVWFISDGSCQLPTEDKAVLSKAFEKMASSLKHLKQYPKEDPRAKADAPLKLSQGFYNLLEFLGVDHATGKHLPELDRVEKSPFYTFIAVRGPDVGIVQMGPNYYAKNTINTDDEKNFHLEFEGVKPPAKFEKPELFSVTASGAKSIARPISIATVMGSWYVDSDGYLRYFTAADFGLAVFVDSLAHEILIDTVSKLSERGVAEVPL